MTKKKPTPTHWRPLTETEIATLIERIGVPESTRQEFTETLRGYLVEVDGDDPNARSA